MTSQFKKGKQEGPGKPFEAGKSGNPQGRPPTSPDVVKARKLNAVEVSRIISEMLYKTQDEIAAIRNDPASSSIQVLIAAIMIKGVSFGDYASLDFIFNRSIGKVTEKVEHKLPKPTVMKLIGSDAVMVFGSKKEDENETN